MIEEAAETDLGQTIVSSTCSTDFALSRVQSYEGNLDLRFTEISLLKILNLVSKMQPS